ncbi:MAG: UDP-N-acetylmuramoyl-tripeptide--D-alanyl-D-alanine ligase [Actinobacteria bacterium]|nr:UDP-N-acetylmuramoyl-tripeptide--D-alanyl-D-alanine ligase [Actinomycetota bacterium]
MIRLQAAEIVLCTGGVLLYGSLDTGVSGVGIDSRAVVFGDLFIPLKGTTDGHAYIEDAIRAGAAGFLIESGAVSRGMKPPAGAQFAVEVADTLRALQAIAAHCRAKLSATVIGVTGSTGKTTTKDMLTAVLSRSMNVVSTTKNYNNEIGVPLTVLKADLETSALVVEMGMRGLGQIKALADIAAPNIGVVTNIGQAHIELLGTQERIAHAKAELIEAISPAGAAVLNADCAWSTSISNRTSARLVTYGIADGDVRASGIEVDQLGRAAFSLTIGGSSSYRVRLAVPGKHNVYNALAAIAVAIEFGLSVDSIRLALAECKPTAMRMEIVTTERDVLILNDAYNANPASMEAALLTLMDIETKGRRIAVLGDMLELGPTSREAHRRIGEIAAVLGVDILIAVGVEGRLIAESAVRAGMSNKAVIACMDAYTATRVLGQLGVERDAVLVKASRAMGLEKIVEALVAYDEAESRTQNP